MPKTIEFYSILEAAELLGFAVDYVKRMMWKDNRFPGKINYEGEWMIPLRDLCSLKVLENAAELHDMPVVKVRRATEKFLKLQDYYRKLSGIAKRNPVLCGTVRQEAAKQCGVALRTIQRWQRSMKLNGLRGLIDTRGGSRQ